MTPLALLAAQPARRDLPPLACRRSPKARLPSLRQAVRPLAPHRGIGFPWMALSAEVLPREIPVPSDPATPAPALPEGLIDKLLEIRDHLETAHQLPGRIRLRLAARAIARLPRARAKQIARELELVGGVTSVRVNLMARSVVIEYDAALIPADLWRDLIHGSRQEAEQALAALAGIMRREREDGLLDDRG